MQRTANERVFYLSGMLAAADAGRWAAGRVLIRMGGCQLKKAVFALISVFILTLICNAQETERECDFSEYKPLVISHGPIGGAIKKVAPEYPGVAKAARVQGEVQVEILVDLKGNVVRSCAAHGHSLLRVAAEEAALEWKFKGNFGFSIKPKSKPRHKYLKSWIVFNFRLE